MSTSIHDIIETEQYAGDQPAASPKEQTTTNQETKESDDTLGGSLSPLLDAEKDDVEFWLEVGQLLCLLYIAYQLSA